MESVTMVLSFAVFVFESSESVLQPDKVRTSDKVINNNR
ncbi:hypothetical Protein YC6258_00447 [Gynuella sunshinyii YC6258]|uniref:Uncharacterized protein n=1 Tax=Gynuella sunshinyii YC6258 TaxID=1445510 RepID=A0A0C5VD78_9GAMM|nr:hypothetical Protein YC6258_00447 [Gynuella sunshinyii YC6258]